VKVPFQVFNSGTSTALTADQTVNSTNNISVVSTTGFPAIGTILIENEAMSYLAINATTLRVLERGLWGTSKAFHSSGAIVTFFNQVTGGSGYSAPQFATTSSGNVWWNGHLTSSGSAPTLSGLGTGPVVVGNDSAGRITVGSTGTTSATFTLTFTAPWQSTPVCFAQDESGELGTPFNSIYQTAGSTMFSVTFNAAVAPANGHLISYQCMGFR
jgi:hypothetical protein